jgi:hypothetical protein
MAKEMQACSPGWTGLPRKWAAILTAVAGCSGGYRPASHRDGEVAAGHAAPVAHSSMPKPKWTPFHAGLADDRCEMLSLANRPHR